MFKSLVGVHIFTMEKKQTYQVCFVKPLISVSKGQIFFLVVKNFQVFGI